jgi:hypothetical protein
MGITSVWIETDYNTWINVSPASKARRIMGRILLLRPVRPLHFLARLLVMWDIWFYCGLASSQVRQADHECVESEVCAVTSKSCCTWLNFDFFLFMPSPWFTASRTGLNFPNECGIWNSNHSFDRAKRI